MDPVSLFDVSHLITFLGGTAVGAAGKYFADLFTDQRKKQEEQKERRARFARIKAQMPELLAEMKSDLVENKEHHMREFVVLASERSYFNSERQRFVYCETKHPAVRNQADILVSEGYIDIVQREGPPIYRLKESFVEQVLHDA